MNTSELEARLAGLLAKATEEWSIVEYGDGDNLAIHRDYDNRVCFMATHGGSRTAWERIQAHADLIAEGKNALPTLLQSLSTLRQRIEALEADNARLREALKPFAKMGELANFAFAPALFHDRDQIKGLPWKDDGETVTITFGDCRRARQALGEG